MENVLSVEELIINDSFINYCFLDNPEDISLWENYLLQNPFEKGTVEEAKLFVLALKNTLKTTEKEKDLERFRRALGEKTPGNGNVNEFNVVYRMPEGVPAERKRKYRWYIAASVIAVIMLSIWMTTGKPGRPSTMKDNPGDVANQMLSENSITQTGEGERKLVFLPDGTRVTMNVKTTLTVDSNFGMNSRLVRLEGEAFFDVQHDTRSPFIVQLKDFNIRVLGTMFNVRSYSGDKNSETALVKGKVEIEENNTHNKLFLRPYEKAILPNPASPVKLLSRENSSLKSIQPLPIVVKPLTISNDGISISETAWMQNRLEINDETFLELKNKLERWYGVKIRFDDEEVKKYKFTATFESENIDQALQAMQLSYPFNYTKKENLIMIEK